MIARWVGLLLWFRNNCPAGLALFALSVLPSQAVTSITLYVAHMGTPAAIVNFIEPDAGCSWTGVGGQVFGPNGQPQNDLVVRVSGVVEGRVVNQSATTGHSVRFGPGGYDIKLGEFLASSSLLQLSVADSSGRLLSGQTVFSLGKSCSQNLTVINLTQKTFSHIYHLPLIRR